MTDYSELKRLAEKATNARWHEDDLGDALEFASIDDEDQDFILAASPAAVFELVAEIDQLKAENEALRKQIDDMSPLKGSPLTGPDLKCLACGGYHYGLGGLPCPKMAPTAGAAMSQGEKS